MPQFNLSLAPQQLWQAINPWTFANSQFGLINISLGQSSQPETEQAILDEVGSYGKQLGRIGDALAVVLKTIDRTRLSERDQRTLTILDGQLAEISAIKEREAAKAARTGTGMGTASTG